MYGFIEHQASRPRLPWEVIQLSVHPAELDPAGRHWETALQILALMFTCLQ